jgi:hypothetical protein
VLDQTSLRVIQLRTMDKTIHNNRFFKITLPAYVLFLHISIISEDNAMKNKCHREVVLLFSCKQNGVVVRDLDTNSRRV